MNKVCKMVVSLSSDLQYFDFAVSRFSTNFSTLNSLIVYITGSLCEANLTEDINDINFNYFTWLDALDVYGRVCCTTLCPLLEMLSIHNQNSCHELILLSVLGVYARWA